MKQMIRQISVQDLEIRMENIMKWRKDKNFEKKSFSEFTKVVVHQAQKLQKEKDWLPNNSEHGHSNNRPNSN